MIDISHTVVPKSNQTNADDFLVGPRTITITKVSLTNNAEQPVAINYEGDDNKPFLPCKTVRRIMIACWTEDASKYIGKSMTLYRDPEVTWSGTAVGGIRVSHMSHLDGPKPLTLRKTKQTVKNYIIQPLASQNKPVLDESAILIHAKAQAEQGTIAFKAHYKTLSPDERAVLQPKMDDLKATCEKADNPPDHEPSDDEGVFND